MALFRLGGLRSRPRGVQAAWLAAALLAASALWAIRPLLHWPLMLVYRYPLLTWIPVVLGFAAAGLTSVAAARISRRRRVENRRLARRVTRIAGLVVTVDAWAVFMIMLPCWQGRALYEATTYSEGGTLPLTTQPRLLPKQAAEDYGDRSNLRQAHLAVDPAGHQLVWTAEEKGGLIPRGASKGIAVQPLDRIDGTLTRRRLAFDPAISRVGPGSLRWRAYKRHFFTSATYPVVVPTADGDAVAVMPYLGYKGFPVRHPYLKGIYVYHRDGKLEDLSLEQALARPELAASGRLFPEKLARDVAEAYGYKSGALATIAGRSRTRVTDAEGNPQPYLTSIGDGRVRWVSVGHDSDDEDAIRAIFLTDASTGATQVWKPGPGQHLVSNRAAQRAARALPREWNRWVCCDSDGNDYKVWIRHALEPRPVFAGGRFYYLVSIVTNRDYEVTPEPVETTVLVDGLSGRRLELFEHGDSEADDRLRAFFANPPER